MEQHCSYCETLKYANTSNADANSLPPLNDASATLQARILRAKRNRLVETYVQTVTEILVDGQPRGFVVCDTTRSLEVKEEFASDFSLNQPRSREATMTVVQSYRETWY